ncbi:MAG TPA: Ig-like domain-containing protein [Anaerolineae bacterium]|nr:Ig-like domain-containing protein [Anaerolineae bacterium]
MPLRAQETTPPKQSSLPVERVLTQEESSSFTVGGPDAFGYTYADSNEASCTTTFNDISGINPGLGLGDDGEASVSLPFTFNYYGNDITALRIGNNGGILINNLTGDVPFNNSALPSGDANLANGVILPFWDDIDSDTGDVYTATVGVAPDRQFIIQWHQRPHFSNVGDSTFQVIFYESSNKIDFVYQDVIFGNPSFDNGASATVGLQQNSGNALQYSFNQPIIADGLAICFSPPSGPGISLEKTVGLDASSCATDDSLVVLPNTEVTYCYEVINVGTVTLTQHDLVDDQLGVLLANDTLSLPPGASTFITASVVIITDTVNNAVWTAYNPGSADVVTATDTAMVTIFTPPVIPADSYGYIVDGNCATTFNDISGINLGLGLLDDGETSVSLPFTFNYYGNNITELRVGNDGGILINNLTGDVPFNNSALPSGDANLANGVILPFWDDIDSDTGDVYTATVGVAPDRQFIIQWHQRPHFSNVGDSTFQVILYEGSNNIDFVYEDVVFGNASFDNGASATVGLQRDSSNALQYSYNEVLVFDGQAICFMAPPNVPPVANDDDYFAVPNMPLSVSAPGVLANDTDANNPLSALTVITVTNPSSGSLELVGNGAFTYTAPVDFTGVVTYTYLITDGTDISNIATVTITVGAVPLIVINEILQHPAAVLDANGEWFEIYNADSNVIDLNGWRITDNLDSHLITATVVVPVGGYAVLCRDSNPATNGGVVCDYEYGDSIQLSNDADFITLSQGAVVDTVAYDGGVEFPDPDGVSMCLMEASTDNSVGSNWSLSTTAFGDGDLGSPGAANLDCMPPNLPPVANDDGYSMNENSSLVVDTVANGVLGNDVDPEGGTLTTTILITDVVVGVLDLNVDGTFTYTPPVDFLGAVTFTYRTTDTVHLSNVATVYINVTDCSLGAEARVTVCVRAEGADVYLDWGSHWQTGGGYEVHRSTMPYYTPDVTTLTATMSINSWQFIDLNAVGEATANYYYYVVPLGCTPCAPTSNHVAEFDYEVVIGSSGLAVDGKD